MNKKTVLQKPPENTTSAQQSDNEYPYFIPDKRNPKFGRYYKTEEEYNNENEYLNSEENRKDDINALMGVMKYISSEPSENHLAELKFRYAEELEKVKNPDKKKTYTTIFDKWDDVINPYDKISYFEKLWSYNNSTKTHLDSKTNFFTDFCIKDKSIDELSQFFIYLKKQSYITFDINKIKSHEFKIKYLKNSHTVFGIAFYKFLSDRFMNEEIENQWITMSKYFTDKTGMNLSNIQLSNNCNNEEKQQSIEKQIETIENLYDDFQAEIE